MIRLRRLLAAVSRRLHFMATPEESERYDRIDRELDAAEEAARRRRVG